MEYVMLKDKVLCDTEGVMFGETVVPTTLKFIGDDNWLCEMHTGKNFQSLAFTRKEARQLRNWLNKALEA